MALLICRERGKGQFGKISEESPDKSGKSRKNRESFFSEDFSLLVAFLLVTFSWLFRGGFFVALFCLEKHCLGLFRGFFVVFRGPRFGQNLRVLALEQSSDFLLTVGSFLLTVELFYLH